jgi:hypothetical protein
VHDEPLYEDRFTILDRVAYKMAVHFKVGPWITKVNRRLVVRAREWQEFDLIWIDKANYVRGDTIERIRDITGAPIVHFTPDIALKIVGTQHSPIFAAAIPSYDAVVTTKNFEVDDYGDHGARLVLFSKKAVSHRRFFPRSDIAPNIRCDVGFIGRWAPQRVRVLTKLRREGLSVAVRGPGWLKLRRQLDRRVRHLDPGPRVDGEDYARHLSGMKVGLGLLAKVGAGDVITDRSLEIPACGTFLMAERTEAHQEVFEEGREAEFFGSLDELTEKTKYYLQAEAARERIAKRGRQRYMESPHRLDRQVEQIVEKLCGALPGLDPRY